jgi:16S rRNA (uracil1498-N3)-methyltransferase
MHRFFIGSISPQDSQFQLPESEALHAVKVLRIRAGEQVVLLHGRGVEFFCEVQETGRREVRVKILQEKVHPPAEFELTLVQAVPKGKAMDLIVQKATELGVSRIVPLLSTRTVRHIDPAEAPAKAEKWRATAVEAIKQCGCPWIPRIDPPAPFSHIQTGAELNFVAALTSNPRHPRELLDAFKLTHGRSPHSVAVWVGPEGDFTGEELESLFSSGVHPITLGPWVLRSETAAICSLAILNYELAGEDARVISTKRNYT